MSHKFIHFELLSETILRNLGINPNIDVSEIKVGTRLTVVRPMNARTLTKVFTMFQSLNLVRPLFETVRRQHGFVQQYNYMIAEV